MVTEKPEVDSFTRFVVANEARLHHALMRSGRQARHRDHVHEYRMISRSSATSTAAPNQ